MTFTQAGATNPRQRESVEPVSVLVIDSDDGVRWSLERGLSHTGYAVQVADTPERALAQLENNDMAAVLMEVTPEAGFTVDVLSALVSANGKSVILCSSVDTSPNVVMECVRRGASGFLPRPFSLGEVRGELSRLLPASREGRASQTGAEPAPTAGVDDDPDSLIVGLSPAVRELRGTLRLVAQSSLNCLIRGESGVGKDVVAREIHRLSMRRDKPFVKVNCTALPEQLLESELFGYERGAFTGATVPKPGRFSLADKGIIFLDEICDVSMPLQAKLLQVIEHKEFTKLGAPQSTKVDVQIIAASNANIERYFEENRFRPDLFFRLNEIRIQVPPLRERKEDIPMLARHFVAKHAGDRTDLPTLSRVELDKLCAADWPGNVRELEGAIKRWLTLGQLIVDDSGPRNRPGAVRPTPSASTPLSAAVQSTPVYSGGEPTPEQILAVLEDCHWNRRKASQVLGMSYQTLRRRIAKHNLNDPNVTG